MRIDILTLFPDTMRAMLGESILGRAQARGLLDIRCHQIRDYTENRQKQVDDYPYGGGWGQVMMAQPLKSCLDAALADSTVPAARRRVIYLSPQGQTFTQAKARQLKADYDQLVLVCGHYEGVDERFIEACVDEELSIGDFVLTGGELGAMVVTDCVCRMVPGVLSDTECYTGESHWAGRLEYPQYTRPETWEGRTVPEVLRGGILAVDAGQMEAARSLGMTHWQAMRKVVFPQAIKNSLPAIGNEFIINIKDSSVLCVVGVSDLMFMTRSVAGIYYKGTECYLIAAIVYLFLTYLSSLLLKAITGKMTAPDNTKRHQGNQTVDLGLPSSN